MDAPLSNLKKALIPFLRLLFGAVVGLFFCSTIALAGGSFIKYVISLSVVPLKLSSCCIFFLSSNSLIYNNKKKYYKTTCICSHFRQMGQYKTSIVVTNEHCVLLRKLFCSVSCLLSHWKIPQTSCITYVLLYFIDVLC